MAHRKHQSHVDADAFRDQLFDGRNAGGRRRYFDHHIGSVNRGPQAFGFVDRALGVVRETGRHFEAHVAIVTVSRVIDRSQHIGRHLNILDRQRFVKISYRRLRIGREQRAQRHVVVGTAGNRFVENRRIAGHAAQPVLFDQPFELTAPNQVAPDIIQPYRLSLFREFFQRIHYISPSRDGVALLSFGEAEGSRLFGANSSVEILTTFRTTYRKTFISAILPLHQIVLL